MLDEKYSTTYSAQAVTTLYHHIAICKLIIQHYIFGLIARQYDFLLKLTTSAKSNPALVASGQSASYFGVLVCAGLMRMLWRALFCTHTPRKENLIAIYYHISSKNKCRASSCNYNAA